MNILFSQLEWRPRAQARGQASVPGPNEGPVSFLVISPWCPDCREIAPHLQKKTPETGHIWLVGEFAPESDTIEFAREFELEWPILFGQPAKSGIALVQARFHQIRSAFGDSRKWGVPLWIEGRLELGWLTVDKVRFF